LLPRGRTKGRGSFIRGKNSLASKGFGGKGLSARLGTSICLGGENVKGPGGKFSPIPAVVPGTGEKK